MKYKALICLGHLGTFHHGIVGVCEDSAMVGHQLLGPEADGGEDPPHPAQVPQTVPGL